MINFKTCTEEELWKYVASHLESKGLEVVLVGGAVVSIYSKGIYKSGDLDFIVTSLFKDKLPQYMKEIGFKKGTKGSLGRLYRHPECNHLVVEFPTGPVSIGEDYHITPSEQTYAGQKIKFSPLPIASSIDLLLICTLRPDRVKSAKHLSKLS